MIGNNPYHFFIIFILFFPLYLRLKTVGGF